LCSKKLVLSGHIFPLDRRAEFLDAMETTAEVHIKHEVSVSPATDATVNVMPKTAIMEAIEDVVYGSVSVPYLMRTTISLC
jgi:hypothetical protein